MPTIALGTCAGYYLATLVGLQLRLPPATTSVMWPPNAVLAAALILTPPRRWAVVLMAALPAHLGLQLQTEWPLALILALFATNCSEAVLVAGTLELFSDTPARFDTPRRLTILLIAAVIGTVLSSFTDAAVVALFRGEHYSAVFRTRLFSNVLAELTILPGLVGGVSALAEKRGRILRGCRTEATILAAGLCGLGWLAFASPPAGTPAFGAVLTRTPLTLQLPFLLWAAVRFGPTGTGLTLLTTSVMSAWAVTHDAGPFAAMPAATTISAMTFSLIVVAVTLLYLSSLIEERRQTQQALRTRLEFERVLSRLSAALVQAPPDQMVAAFDPWLGKMASVLRLDGVTVFEVSDRITIPQAIYSWSDPLHVRPPATTPPEQARWARESLILRDLAISADIRPLGAAIGGTQAPGPLFEAGGAVPLVGDGQVLGALAFATIHAREWSDDVITNIRLVGEVLASALGRKRADDALRASEGMKSAILQSLTSGVAVLDRSGRLLQVNERWRSAEHGLEWMDGHIGGNFLETCWAAFEKGDRFAGEIVAGVGAVLDGSRDRFVIEHRRDASQVPEWWSLMAVPLNRPDGGAVITRADITELRRAEMEAQRSRQELAHVSRVSTVGEMTASLAHQLNQPLAAIITNAGAGNRILDASRPDMTEVRAILGDVMKDARRASDVIQRLRELLRKGDFEMTKVNVTAAIRDVVDLVSSEAIIRNIPIQLAFEHEPLYVRGDRVQLQQVILNLLQNAMEAMHDVPDPARRIVVDCRHRATNRILVAVHDSGPGIGAGTEELIFEPFYTTKSSGMGMGLSIARSIVEAHGGTIRAASDGNGGATLEFLLPAGAGRS